jgi:hypothetical protein
MYHGIYILCGMISQTVDRLSSKHASRSSEQDKHEYKVRIQPVDHLYIIRKAENAERWLSHTRTVLEPRENTE